MRIKEIVVFNIEKLRGNSSYEPRRSRISGRDKGWKSRFLINNPNIEGTSDRMIQWKRGEVDGIGFPVKKFDSRITQYQMNLETIGDHQGSDLEDCFGQELNELVCLCHCDDGERRWLGQEG